MSDQLLKEASKMFENENQWQAACKLADLIPAIKSYWFKEFMDLLSENITSNLEKDDRFDAFQIMSWSGNDEQNRYWYIMPKDSNIEEDEDGEPLGLSTAIEILIENNEFSATFALTHHYKNKRPPALPKMKKFFTEGLRAVLSDFKDNEMNEWNYNGWVIWDNLYPKGKNTDLSEPETIYYLHEHGQEFIDVIIEKILTFVSKHRDALISAHDRLIKQDFE